MLNYSKLDEEMAILTNQVRAAGTRVLFSAPYNPGPGGTGTGYDSAIAAMQSEGLDVNALTLPRSGGFLSGLTTGIAFTTPAWGKLRKLDFEGRLALIQDEDERAKLIEDAKKHPQVEEAAKNFYWLGDEERPKYARDASESLYGQAKAAGRHPVELWLDKMLETDFHVRFFNHNLETLKGFLTTDWVLPGIGDAGAHVSQIMDSGWTSFLLAHWHRENDLFTIEEAVRRMTSASARVIGFKDRGALKPGMKADVNVIDIDRVAERQPVLVHDFPDGAPRLIQKAMGYEATICNGSVILENDTHTGERSGRVLRNPATC